MNNVFEREFSQNLRTQGWTVVRGMHSQETIRGIQEMCLEELQNLQVTDGQFENGQPRFCGADDVNISTAAVLPRSRKSELLRELSTPIGLISALEEFYQDEVFIHPNQWMRAMPPDEEEWVVAPSVHADCFELQGTLKQITIWSPVFEVSPKSGSLPIYTSNNFNGIPAGLEIANDNQSGWTLNEVHLGDKSILDLFPGDALVFLATTPHGGAKNESQGWRISVETRYQPMSEPIDQNALRPYDGNTWEYVQEGWNNQERPWETTHPPLKNFDPVWEDWRAVEAIKLGSRGDERSVQALKNALMHANKGIREQAQNILNRYQWS